MFNAKYRNGVLLLLYGDGEAVLWITAIRRS